MLANRSVSFDPCIDDDMSSLCSSFITANVGPSIRRGKYSQYNPYYNPPSIQEDLVSEKDLDCFFEDIDCDDNNPNKSKFNNSKKNKMQKQIILRRNTCTVQSFFLIISSLVRIHMVLCKTIYIDSF